LAALSCGLASNHFIVIDFADEMSDSLEKKILFFFPIISPTLSKQSCTLFPSSKKYHTK